MRVRTIATAIVTLSLLSAVLAGCSRGSEPIVIEQPGGSAEETAAHSTTGTADGGASLDSIAIELEKVADGFEQPLCVVGVPESDRLVVLEKTGRAWLVKADGAVLTTPFLDLSDRVTTDSEQGLLGLTFSPAFATNGRFYVNYTDADAATVVSRFTAQGDRATTDNSSEEQLLRIDQPYANHNGGCIALGPDGMLWIGMGDGGSGGDPHGNGQNLNSLLGKMLRIDVGESGAPPNGEPYGIPADNPFANPASEEDGGFPEIWALGLRNPWRFSFDSTSGDLWIGDVGQNSWEEIDYVPASLLAAPPVGGLNFGWNTFEGTHPFLSDAAAAADPSRFAMPVIEYDRAAGQSVTGGVVYRDTTHPELNGVYFYGDFGSGRIWGARHTADGSLETAKMLDSGMQIVSFGQADDGGVYAVDFSGTVYRITTE